MIHQFNQTNSSENEQAAVKEQEASVESAQKASDLKKWTVVLLPVAVVAWWSLKRICQRTDGEIQQLEFDEPSNVLAGIEIVPQLSSSLIDLIALCQSNFSD